MIKTIVAFVIIFGILVLIHEFGHFYFAKRSGILVREFSIGMGPKLFWTIKNGTLYTIRLLPLGGYVRMAGFDEDEDELRPGMPISVQLNDRNEITKINTTKEDRFDGIPLIITDFDLSTNLFISGYKNGDEDNEVKYTVNHDATIIENDGSELLIAPKDVQFQSASIGHRLMTNFAGPMNNFILAFIVFAIIGFVNGGTVSNSNQIAGVINNSPAQRVGLKAHDQIIAINGKQTKNWDSLTTQIAKNGQKELDLKIKRNNKIKSITLKPKVEQTNGHKSEVIGITREVNHSLYAKLCGGFVNTCSSLFKALQHLFVHFSLNDLGGPVAIYANTSTAVKSGMNGILYWLAFLSLNLGIVNLIPIPGLDGGKLLFNLIELITRKRISEKVEMIVTSIFFVLLMILMVLVTWNDIVRYFLH